ncbi:unnamed protein product [Pieris macdunnoughi]|uniref:Uncharacterized protein n=1 Tax=Pieris macdunnoughi TaxID=345717 RepID=A0A821SSG4_9NEOP|nr:unnamed protein product [Pieris macdunnoughi]
MRQHSDDYDSEGSEEYSDEEVYSQGAHEEELSSSSEGTGGSDLRIFNFDRIQDRSRRRPVVDHALVIYQLNLQGNKHQSQVYTRQTSAQSSTLPDSDIGFSPSRHAPRQLEFDSRENLFADNISTPSVSLLRSNTITPYLSPEHNDAPPALSVLRSQSSTPDLPSDNDDAPLPQNSRNNSPSHHGTNTTWSSNPISMKTIDFTKKQELLRAIRSLRCIIIDDDLLDLIVRETNSNAVRVGVQIM